MTHGQSEEEEKKEEGVKWEKNEGECNGKRGAGEERESQGREGKRGNETLQTDGNILQLRPVTS